MLKHCGLQNVLEQYERYPVLTPEIISSLNPDIIMYSSEPYPFKEKHFEEFKERYPKARHALVDGEMFSWFGTRVLESFSYFQTVIPQLIEDR